jgi:hypothetical protein
MILHLELIKIYIIMWMYLYFLFFHILSLVSHWLDARSRQLNGYWNSLPNSQFYFVFFSLLIFVIIYYKGGGEAGPALGFSVPIPVLLPPP